MAEHRPSDSIEAVESGLAAQGYIASRQIATAVYLAQQIEKPILVEGPAVVLQGMNGARLFRRGEAPTELASGSRLDVM